MTRNDRYFVIAGNANQANEFIKRKALELFNAGDIDISLSHFSYVSTPDTLRGHSEVHGWFVGTYRDRPDIEELCTMIRIINKVPANTWIIPPNE